jgi:AcrR family transcriptional regulator
VPKLWNQTIDAHRREVRDAILNAAADLVTRAGLHAVTMSQIAADTGIGRATLYKYFSDVESILNAWHERNVAAHLEQLGELHDLADRPPLERLTAVLQKFALICFEHHGSELATVLHRGERAARAERRLAGLIRSLLRQGAEVGEIRDDVAAHELASYCVHAVSGASGVDSKAAALRLVEVTLSGVRCAAGSPTRRRGRR